MSHIRFTERITVEINGLLTAEFGETPSSD
jgi:hypothetical protein